MSPQVTTSDTNMSELLFLFTVGRFEQIRRGCIGYVVCAGIELACSYDRSRIKRGDIFSRNIRSREIETESDKPAGVFLLLFSLFWKLRAYVERIRRFINDVMILASLSFLPSLPRSIVSLRLSLSPRSSRFAWTRALSRSSSFFFFSSLL